MALLRYMVPLKEMTVNRCTDTSLPCPLPFFLPYVVPIITILTHYSSQPLLTLIAPTFVWIIVPFLDLLIPPPASPPLLAPQHRQALNSNLYFRVAVLLWCPTQLCTLIWAAYRLQQTHNPVSGIRLFGLASSIGLIAAEGINCSHELLHRTSRKERFLGNLLLISVLYAHFTIEHAKGHHINVATPHDPATFRQGESFYYFFPRTLINGYRSAWRIESLRLRRHSLSVFSLDNKLILFAVSQFSFCSFFYIVFGLRALSLVLFQAAFAIVLLEQVNAIEHYGLSRRKLPSGIYEPVGPRHSWDAPHRISSYLLFKLQLHADHHLRTLFLISQYNNNKGPLTANSSSLFLT